MSNLARSLDIPPELLALRTANHYAAWMEPRRAKRSDVRTGLLLAAVYRYGMDAFEKLCAIWPRKVVLAAIERDTRRGLLSWGVCPQRPFLTEQGETYLKGWPSPSGEPDTDHHKLT